MTKRHHEFGELLVSGKVTTLQIPTVAQEIFPKGHRLHTFAGRAVYVLGATDQSTIISPIGDHHSQRRQFVVPTSVVEKLISIGG